MTVRVEHADMLEAIPRLVATGVVCDAVVTDPPYHLTDMTKRFGAGNARPPVYGKDGALGRLAKGFMNSSWDGGDIAFRPETWATVATILRPGAFVVAFGGTRTYHRLACAIEDGGFVIQDCLMWLFATGFPKRRDMLKPAYEPIVLAYKPGGKRTMQIDECRIGTETRTYHGSGPHNIKLNNHGKGDTGIGMMDGSGRDLEFTVNGRWPANVCHDGSDEVLAAFDKFGDRLGARPISDKVTSDPTNGITLNKGLGRIPFAGIDDSGSAARFFFSAKAGAQDRWGSRHPTVKPVELMKWLAALVCQPDGLLLDPFAGSGTTGVAALATGRNAILIEREDAYVADIRERMAHYEGEGRHSLASKARRTQDTPLGGLFAEPFDEGADARASYDEAVRAIGERVKAGEPVPPFFLPTVNKL